MDYGLFLAFFFIEENFSLFKKIFPFDKSGKKD